jgi:hypothetical protein
VKLTLPFKAGMLPRIDPERPRFTIDLGGVIIAAEVSAKAARKCGVHEGAAVLQGRLLVQGGRLVLTEVGFQFIDPKPPQPAGAGVQDAAAAG